MIEQNFMYFHEILLYHNYTTLYHKMYRIFKISFQAVMSGMPLFCSVVQGLEFLRMVGIYVHV